VPAHRSRRFGRAPMLDRITDCSPGGRFGAGTPPKPAGASPTDACSVRLWVKRAIIGKSALWFTSASLVMPGTATLVGGGIYVWPNASCPRAPARCASCGAEADAGARAPLAAPSSRPFARLGSPKPEAGITVIVCRRRVGSTLSTLNCGLSQVKELTWRERLTTCVVNLVILARNVPGVPNYYTCCVRNSTPVPGN
jgi:hypothetical protein